MAAYCSQCGEKRRDRADWKLSSIASEAFAEITNLEHSKLWQTFRLLLFKPGQLTREYWNGRRKRFLGPVKLYLVFFALSLLLYSIHWPTAIYDVRTSQLPIRSAGSLASWMSWRTNAECRRHNLPRRSMRTGRATFRCRKSSIRFSLLWL